MLETLHLSRENPQGAYIVIVSFAWVFTSSFVPRVDTLPKSENDTTDCCENEIIKVSFDVMVFRHIFSTRVLTCFRRKADRHLRYHTCPETRSILEWKDAPQRGHHTDQGYECAPFIPPKRTVLCVCVPTRAYTFTRTKSERKRRLQVGATDQILKNILNPSRLPNRRMVQTAFCLY
jgi:hypothetical protein